MAKDIDVNILNIVQHVELNKVGWWDYVIQRLVLATLWMGGEPDSMPIATLKESICSYFGLHLDVKLDPALYQLIASGDIIRLSDGSIKLSESSAKLINSDIQDAEAIILKAQNAFVDNLSHERLQPEEKEQIWITFNDVFLRPFIKNIGANIYELLNGKSVNIDQSLLDTFLSKYAIEKRECLNNCARFFLNSRDPNVRSYILRSLNAYFCIEASGLNKITLESLQVSLAQPKDLILFIDTNFLFSILELHENPSNAAAVGLVELINNLDGKFNVKLYVLNQTIHEARSVLLDTIGTLNGTRLTPNMAEAASRFVSGLSKKFYSEVNRSNIPQTPKEYFQPYVDNFVTILKSKGVEVFNEKTENLNMRQDVIDDILEQSKYEEQKWGERAKAYKPLEHDIVLWNFIKDKRKVGIDSPLDAVYWIVTIDYRFLGFDDYKKSNSIINVPICIHPTTIIQLLQFWVPRSQLLEDTLYSSLWLPFIFRDFDPQAENTTIEIVKTLGRFENIGDLSKDTIVRILVNEALRQKIKNETDVEKQIELVREALIDQNQHALAQADKAISKNIEYEQELQKKEADIARLVIDLQATRDELCQERNNRQELSDEIFSIKAKIEKKDRNDLINATKQKYGLVGIVLPFLFVVIAWVLTLSVFRDAIKIIGIITGILLIIWGWLFDYFGSRNVIFSALPRFKKYHSVVKLISSLLGIIVIGIFTNALYDYLKKILSNIFHGS